MTKRLKNQLQTGATTGGPTGPVSGITTENYSKKVQDFIKANGNMGFVLTPHVYFTSPGGQVYEGSTHEEITAWRIYYQRKGLRQKRNASRSVALGSMMAPFFETYGGWTVPCQWPWDFDRDYDRNAGVVPFREPPKVAFRRDLDDPLDEPADD